MYHLYRYDNELLEAAAMSLKTTLPRYLCVHACMYVYACVYAVRGELRWNDSSFFGNLVL